MIFKILLTFCVFTVLASGQQNLCNIGCKCFPKDYSTFTDCSFLGLSKLPSLLTFDPGVLKVFFQSNSLTELKRDAFDVGNSTITELDLSKNQITTIEDSTFASFRSLNHLRLSYNKISEISPGVLIGLENLQVLEISHNDIRTISHLVFETTPKLQELKLQYNYLYQLPEDLFRFVPNLQKLDLEDTGLVSLPTRLFMSTPYLRRISLANNAFENVPEEALAQASHLETLDLSGNDFTILGRGAFQRLTNVSLLQLNNLQRLLSIDKDAFAGLQNLKSLSCGYNPYLSFIHEDAFGSLNSTISFATPPREQLHLRKNALTTFKSSLGTEAWSSIPSVDLGENPWNCDCNLKWMKDLNREIQANIICVNPSNLRKLPLSAIHEDDLICDSRWTLTAFALAISSMAAFGIIFIAASAIACSRTPVGLYVRAKQQFFYAKILPKTETVDLEWDPSGEI